MLSVNCRSWGRKLFHGVCSRTGLHQGSDFSEQGSSYGREVLKGVIHQDRARLENPARSLPSSSSCSQLHCISKSYCDTGSCAASHLNSLKQLHLQTCCIVLTRIRLQKRKQLSLASTLKGPIMPDTLDTCYSTAALKSLSFVGRSPLMACAEISNVIHSNSHLIVCRSTRYPLNQAKSVHSLWLWDDL